MTMVIKKVLLSILVVLLILTSFPLVNSSKHISENNLQVQEQSELHLLRVEHYLFLKADDDVDAFNVKYACSPIYNYQVPIIVQIFNDTGENITNYKIESDAFEPNKFVNFTVKPMQKDEERLVHFTVWTIVESHGFGDLPDYIRFPEGDDLPEETKKWLSPTEVSQSENLLIKLKAKQIRSRSDNLITFASKVGSFIKNHRYPLFLLQLTLGLFVSQDAFTTLLINGENVGRSHLACALMRSQNVPARVLLVNNDQGFWTQMHYMAEYYCPGYGWVLIETTRGISPYDTQRQVINRICYPDDENNTKKDYIFRFMKGEEPWIWVDNENVKPHYIDCKEGSKSQMFDERVLLTEKITTEEVFSETKIIFNKYQQYQGINLTGDNYSYFTNATGYQKDAIDSMKNDDISGYINFIELANQEYDKILT